MGMGSQRGIMVFSPAKDDAMESEARPPHGSRRYRQQHPSIAERLSVLAMNMMVLSFELANKYHVAAVRIQTRTERRIEKQKTRYDLARRIRSLLYSFVSAVLICVMFVIHMLWFSWGNHTRWLS
jgi:hypothetical protein